MRRSLLALALSLIALPAAAHEFWFEPEDYTIAPGEQIRARAINGENFFGIEYGYSEGAYRRSGVVSGLSTGPVAGTLGMKPAIQVQPLAEGLNVVYHASPVATLSYPNFIKFENFLKGKHLDFVIAEHKARGYPDEGIREAYFRFVKTLVAVGHGRGADRIVGMPYELFALSNPYTDSGAVRVRVLLRGEPVANAPVFVFHKVGTEVEKIDLVTDAAGDVAVPRRAGAFMVNAVHISDPAPAVREATKAHWQTLWASMTYEIAN